MHSAVIGARRTKHSFILISGVYDMCILKD